MILFEQDWWWPYSVPKSLSLCLLLQHSILVKRLIVCLLNLTSKKNKKTCTRMYTAKVNIFQILKPFFYIAYLSSCHRTASDANYWAIRVLFIALTTLCCKKSAPTKVYPVIQCSCRFFYVFVHWILLLIRSHQAEIMIVKCLIQQRN